MGNGRSNARRHDLYGYAQRRDRPGLADLQLESAMPEQESARLHKATFDIRAYANRFSARLLLSGGVLAYRLEILDPRRPAVRFIDRHFHFHVENDKFRLGLNLVEGPFLTQIDQES